MSASGLCVASGEYTASKPRSARGRQRAQLPIQHRPNRGGVSGQITVVEAIVPMHDPMGASVGSEGGEPGEHVVDGRNRCVVPTFHMALPPVLS